jgi:hypothetical protein
LCECQQADDLNGKHWKAKPVLHGVPPYVTFKNKPEQTFIPYLL